ncbi:hypothetical protein P3S67_003942 [Capsicum chacoense]
MVNIEIDIDTLKSKYSRMKVTDHNHPLHLSIGDVPRVVPIGIQLVGTKNYSLWSKAIRLALLTRKKLEFIDGIFVKEDFQGAIRVVKYIKQSPSLGIFLSSSTSFKLQALCDDD